MDLPALRRWVRQELPPEERRVVGRWILRSRDPELPHLLQGLIREWEDARADAALRLSFPERSFVSELWQRLLDMGAASVDSLLPVTWAGGAVLGGATVRSGISFRQQRGEVLIDLRIAGESRRLLLLATTDSGEEYLLEPEQVLEPGTYLDVARWTPETGEGRVTVWMVLAPPGLSPLPATLTQAAEQEVELIAARWVDPG